MSEVYFEIEEFPRASIVASHISCICWSKGSRAGKRLAKYNKRTKTFKYYPESWSIWIDAKVYIYVNGNDKPFKVPCNSNSIAEEYCLELSERLRKQLSD